MAMRFKAVMRGGRKPLVVLVRSSRALAFGGLMPTPSEPVVKTASVPLRVRGLAPAAPVLPVAPVGPVRPWMP